MINQEQQKRIKASLGTTGVCVVVFLLLLLTSAWDTAQSGLGEGMYPGIEVNVGSSDQGSGNDQPIGPVGSENATDTEDAPSQDTEEPPTPNVAPAPVEEAPVEKVAEPATMTDPKSDVEIKEVKKEVKPAEKAPEKKPTEKPTESKSVEKPKLTDKNAVYQPKTTGASNTSGDGKGKQGTSGNEGDDVGKTGDKGVAGGTPGANVYTGRPGGGKGGSLDMAGWNWDSEPKPVVPNNESGRVVFDIVVNADGEIESIKTKESSVSIEAEQACRREVQKLSFSRTGGTTAPDRSTGTITFVITSR